MGRPKKEDGYRNVKSVKFPVAVDEAITKYVVEKQEEFPRYGPGDLIRAAVVRFLKDKGYLKQEVNYL